MNAAKIIQQHLSLRKSLVYAGVYRRQWYYKPKIRDGRLNPDILGAVLDANRKRPTYGAWRMAAQITRGTGIVMNHKQIRLIYRRMGYIRHLGV